MDEDLTTRWLRATRSIHSAETQRIYEWTLRRFTKFQMERSLTLEGVLLATVE